MAEPFSSSEEPKAPDGPRSIETTLAAAATGARRGAQLPLPGDENGALRRFSHARPILIAPGAMTWLASVGLVGYLAIALQDLWVPSLFAATLTFLGAPLVHRLERRGISRYLGAFLFLGLVGGALSALLLLVLPRLISQLGGAMARLPELLARLQNLFGNVAIANGRSGLDDAFESAQRQLLQSAQDIAAGAAQTISAILGTTALVVLVPLLAYFLLAELPSLGRFVSLLLPARVLALTQRHASAIQGALAHMLRGQLIVAGVLSVFYALGLSVVGVPLPVAIGVLAGFGYLIPFASTPLCLSLSALFIVLEPTGPKWWPLAGALVVALLGQVLESWFLTPRIVGKRAQLSPLAVIIAAIVGAELFGFAGVLFALPVGTVLGVLLRDKLSRATDTEHPTPAASTTQ